MRRSELLRRAALDYPHALRLRGGSVRERAVPARYAEGRLRPVVVIPGVYETWHFLRPIADVLCERGHPVHIVPGMGANARPIPQTAELVGSVIAELGLRDVAIVAHSKGGLIGKLAMAGEHGDRIGRLAAVASPFQGSTMARWMPGRTLRAFLPSDPVILSLTERRDLNARITSIFPTFDPHIPGGSRLEGARNVEIDVVGHFGILQVPAAIDAVIEAVEREAPEQAGGQREVVPEH